MIVGRSLEIQAITAALDAAREGRGAAVCFEGDAGIGKSTLLDAAEASAAGFLTLRTVGVESTLTMGHSGLADVLSPLRTFMDAVPAPQRQAIEAALGWAGATTGQRYLVAAGTLSLLAAAAADQPVLVVIDDLQWLDRESVAALLFAVRRLEHDAVAAVMAFRTAPDKGLLAGIPVHRVKGLEATDARTLLRGQVAEPVVDGLVAETDGNPLAMLEVARSLTPTQRIGSSPLPHVLPLSDRLAAAFGRTVDELSPPSRRALLLAAASTEATAGGVVGALTREGIDPEHALDEAERAGMLLLRDGQVLFRHPLVRAAVWNDAAPAEQRSAHRSLADVLPQGSDQWVRHVSEATLGYDDEVAGHLLRVAAAERRRRGYAAAAVLEERAAQLTRSPTGAAAYRAAAVEDAFLSGDMARVRTLAAAVLDGPADAQARGRALLTLGTLEQYAGSMHRARELLEQAASILQGEVRLRAVVELAHVSYRLNLPAAMASAACRMTELADVSDPEQEMLACYVEGSALAFGGRWAQARAPMARALDLLEAQPALRDEPRYLTTALVAAAWMGEPTRALQFLDRRMDAARRLGALGVLPLALSLIAGGAAPLNQHHLAYAYAGEAVELGVELGYAADVAIAHELLAWQAAARGLHTEATQALGEARRLAEIAGVAGAAVQVDLVDGFAALCRGDLARAIAVLERRITVDDGRLPRGDYPLSVAPDLVEAYLGVGRTSDAVTLAQRHNSLHRDSPHPDIRGHAARLRAMIAADETGADAAFTEAHRAHAEGVNSFEAARTRLLHGSRLRRAGQRIAARQQLEEAATAFRTMGLDGWTARAEGELAATGRTVRRGAQEGDQLTSQETRVVLLIARGLSNREIAAALFLSPKTVEHHVTNALRKRGMRSRTELAVAYS